MTKKIIKNVLQHAHACCRKCGKRAQCSSEEIQHCFESKCGFHILRDGTITTVKKRHYVLEG